MADGVDMLPWPTEWADEGIHDLVPGQVHMVFAHEMVNMESLRPKGADLRDAEDWNTIVEYFRTGNQPELDAERKKLREERDRLMKGHPSVNIFVSADSPSRLTDEMKAKLAAGARHGDSMRKRLTPLEQHAALCSAAEAVIPDRVRAGFARTVPAADIDMYEYLRRRDGASR